MEDSLGDGDQLELTQTSFHYYENYGGEGWQRVTDCPRSIDEVLELLLMVMKRKEEFDPQEEKMFSDMEGEFFQNKDLINAGFEKIVWESSDDYENHITSQFYFDPLSGERYFYEDERSMNSEKFEVGNNRYTIEFSELYDSALSYRGLPRPNEDLPYTTYRARVEDLNLCVDGNSEEEVRETIIQKLKELSE